ncbi:MAG: hypothetical protein C4531_06170 [Desulfurivibrio sp.]|nr:MAG: hypothetical protein C4531_06170 [Desulfurivibrio sp.]
MVVSGVEIKKQAAKLFHRLTLVNLLDRCRVFFAQVKAFPDFGSFDHMRDLQMVICPVNRLKISSRLANGGGYFLFTPVITICCEIKSDNNTVWYGYCCIMKAKPMA